MLPVALVYGGLALALAGLINLLRPLRFLRITSRRRATELFLAGLLLVALGFRLPPSEVRIAEARSRLDDFAPAYQFNERHSLHVEASPPEVFRAIRAVRADDIFLFRTLTAIRRLGRPGPESILNAPEGKPLLDVATATSFLLLAVEPDREIVVGTLVLAPPGFRPSAPPTRDDFKRLSGPGFAKATMNFLVEPDGRGGSNLSTETRVFATDPSSVRRFAAYWRVIYPGSAFIRRMWLRAIGRRAETPRQILE